MLQHQAWDIPVLVTVQPEAPDSLMFHYPAVEWTKLQAEALGLEHVTIRTRLDVTSGLSELERALSSMKSTHCIEGIATGAVASDYQKARFDGVCDRAGLKSYSPLWHKKPEDIVSDLIRAGFKIILTGVAAKGLDESWLGRTLDEDAWETLGRLSSRHGIHLTGEGGEYESFVTDAPNFLKPVRVIKSQRIWDGQSGHLVIEAASLGRELRD